MRKYLARRLILALGTLFGVSVIIFVVMRILPGDPLVAMFGMEGFTKLDPSDRARLIADLGLADPLPVQYVRWLRDIATGSLGRSFFRGDSVRDLIIHRGPARPDTPRLSGVQIKAPMYLEADGTLSPSAGKPFTHIQPDEKRVRRACGRAAQVFIYAYGGRVVDTWWDRARGQIWLADATHTVEVDLAPMHEP